MRMAWRTVQCASVLVTLAAAGCALPDRIADAPNGRTIAAHKVKAADLTRKGDLAGALVEWQILEALTGHDAEVARQRRKLESEIARRAAAKFELGRQAAAKGSLETARKDYLAVLKVDPNHRGAIEELRKIEVVRVRRSRPKMGEPAPHGQATAPPVKSSNQAAAPESRAWPTTSQEPR